jgi:PKD repeat protein
MLLDTSTGEVTERLWNFGDGKTGSALNPLHTYGEPGTYTVNLTVSGPGGTDTKTVSNAVTVTEAPPVASFDASVTSGLAPLVVTFSNTSQGDLSSLRWDFGDGSVGDTPIVVHTYTGPGIYSVTLEATGVGGSDTVTKTNLITVTAAPLDAGFAVDTTEGPAPLTVNFTDQSTGEVTDWFWDFGDGLVGGAQYPTHTYREPGNYTVSLTVSGPNGSDQETKTALIKVNGEESPLEGKLEHGEVRVNHDWKRVDFALPFNDPIVVAKPLSLNGGQPATVRVRNVDPTGFEVRVQEWDYLDGKHAWEELSYIVIERGTYTLADGTQVEAGLLKSSSSGKFENVPFSSQFSTVPVVISSVASENQGNAVVTRNRKVSRAGFQLRIQEQELNGNSWHGSESVHFIAWEPSAGHAGQFQFEVGLTPDAVTQDFYPITYSSGFDDTPSIVVDMQTQDGGDVANLRYRSKTATGIEVMVHEEQSRDNETNHATEQVGYIVLRPAL